MNVFVRFRTFSGCDPRTKKPLVLDVIKTTVAHRIAAKDSPAGENRSSESAILLYRVDCVGRAGRVVLATRSQERRDQLAVGVHRQQHNLGSGRAQSVGERFHVSQFERKEGIVVYSEAALESPVAGAPISSERACLTPLIPSRSTSSAASGRASTT